MNRDCRKNADYWMHSSSQKEKLILMSEETLQKQGLTNKYDASISFNLSLHHLRLMLSRYSGGDSIISLGNYFSGMIDAWEEAYRLSLEINHEDAEYPWRTKEVGCYQTSFCVIGLALALNIPDEQWQRLLLLIGNQGKDILLDRIIATRQPDRKIGTALCHPKPYARLLAAINSPVHKQAKMLASFVAHWYPELKRRRWDDGPYWYGYHENCPDDWYNYFGYWCVEAVAVVKAFGLDDSLCLGHPHYPGDLLRPDGPTTHVPCSQEQLDAALEKPRIRPEKQEHWWQRWYKEPRIELRKTIKLHKNSKTSKKSKNK